MRKGFTVTLLTVAVAMLGSNAMSMAPVISEIKDIVVADDTPVSGGNHFVYPDAIDLNSVVNDPDTSDSLLIWSYSETTNTYSVNNVASLDIPGGDTIVLPPVPKRVAGAGSTTDDPDQVDNNKFTITVRNKGLSPVGGPDVDPAGSGIVSSQTRPLTFFVSDQDKTTSETIMVYTDDDGTDRLSPAGGLLEYNPTFSASSLNGWAPQQTVGGITTSAGATGLCLVVPALGDNVARWDSPYAPIQLTDNAVYEIRMQMFTTQTAPNAVPFWDMGLINGNVNPATGAGLGANTYGGNFYFLDNLGDSQGIGFFRNEFVVYFTPPSVSFASWRSTTTGAFQAAADPFNDFQFNFRVFDIGSSGYGANNDSGSVCLTQMSVYRHDLGSLITNGGPVYSKTNMVASDFTTTAGFGATSFTFANGDVTIAPTSATAWSDTQDSLIPGNGSDAAPQNSTNYPLPWTADKLYLIEVGASIPNASTQTNGGPDLIQLMMEGYVQTYQLSYVLPNIKYLNAGTGGAALPPVAPSTETYKAFGYTNEESKASDYALLRPRVTFQNITGIGFPDKPTGSLTITSIEVKDVTF